MISDKLVIAIGILEVLLFGGVVYGFSFLQTVLEKEFTYWEYFWYLGCKFFLFYRQTLLRPCTKVQTRQKFWIVPKKFYVKKSSYVSRC